MVTHQPQDDKPEIVQSDLKRIDMRWRQIKARGGSSIENLLKFLAIVAGKGTIPSAKDFTSAPSDRRRPGAAAG